MRRRRTVPIGESGPAQLLLQRLRTCRGGNGAGRGQRPRGLAVPVSGGLAPTVLFLGSRGRATVLPWDRVRRDGAVLDRQREHAGQASPRRLGRALPAALGDGGQRPADYAGVTSRIQS